MPSQPLRDSVGQNPYSKSVPAVSARFRNGALVELVYDPERRLTAFAVWHGNAWRLEPSVIADDGQRLVPYSARNNLIQNDVVLLPSGPEEYGSATDLVGRIQAFIHRYVDVSPLYEQLTSYYVILSWLYDDFAELPYLRVRGDPGSGKTRFLLTVGSLCYKPIFASGASTVSPLFRLLDTFRGTLIIDESDFRFSDERAEIVKILNNGNGKGFPVLRNEVSGKGEYNPRAYHVFGPKLVATRGYFEDRALESRCLTEEMGGHRLRSDVPINRPEDAAAEARHLRNQLLLFRFRNLGKFVPSEALVDRAIEPRLNQVFVPLLAVIDDPEVRRQVQEVARRYDRDLIADRAMDTEAQVLEIVTELAASPDIASVSVKDVTDLFTTRYAGDYERKVTPKWIGTLIRRRLGLKAQKRDGIFVLPVPELAKLDALRERYGIGDRPGSATDIVDVVDVSLEGSPEKGNPSNEAALPTDIPWQRP